MIKNWEQHSNRKFISCYVIKTSFLSSTLALQAALTRDFNLWPDANFEILQKVVSTFKLAARIGADKLETMVKVRKKIIHGYKASKFVISSRTEFGPTKLAVWNY